jgi:hypothetical protein
MSKLETNTIDTISGTSNLVIGSTNSSTVTFESGAATGQNYPAFAASVTSDQSISSATWTKIQFNNEILDTNNAYDPTTNYRFTVPTGQAGKYYVCLDYVSCSNSDNLIYSILGIRKNGTMFKRSDMNSNGTSNAAFRRFQVNSSTIENLNAGDYIEAFAYISATSPFINGDDVETRSFFGAYRIGA